MNQLRFVYHNANDVCILDTFDILIIIMVVLKMLCDQNNVWTKWAALHPHMCMTEYHRHSPEGSFGIRCGAFNHLLQFASFVRELKMFKFSSLLLSTIAQTWGLKMNPWPWKQQFRKQSYHKVDSGAFSHITMIFLRRWNMPSCHYIVDFVVRLFCQQQFPILNY